MQNNSISTERVIFLYNPNVSTTTTTTTAPFTTTTTTTQLPSPVTTTTTTPSYPLAYNVSGFGSSVINGCYAFNYFDGLQYWYFHAATPAASWLRGSSSVGWWLQVGDSYYHTSSPVPTTGWYVWGLGVDPIGTVTVTTGCS